MRTIAAALLALAATCFSAQAQITLPTNPGPANNGINAVTGAALLLDIQAVNGVVITGFTTASHASLNAAFQVRIHTRTGSALGGPVTSGPGSAPDGWTLHGTFDATQGAVDEVSLPITITDLPIAAGQVLGVAIVFTTPMSGPRYFGSGATPHEIYADANISVVTGDVRNMPFSINGTFFSSRALVGTIIYRLPDGLFASGFEDAP